MSRVFLFLYVIVMVVLSIHVKPEMALPFLRASDGPHIVTRQDPPSPARTNAPSGTSSPSEGTPPKASKPNGLLSPAVTLKLAFMAEPGLFPYQLECHIHDNTVELTGVVSDAQEKDLAADIAREVVPEKEVLNQITIEPGIRAALQSQDDARLTGLIRQRFADSQTLREANFEVMTIRGMVTLKGQTRFQVIALEAAQAAREVPGVIAVNTSRIRLKGEE